MRRYVSKRQLLPMLMTTTRDYSYEMLHISKIRIKMHWDQWNCFKDVTNYLVG